VLTIQNKATWDQDRGAIYIGHSGPDGVGRRSNGRIEVGHPSSPGNLTIGNDVVIKIGDLGGTGVVDVNNGTLTVKASNDTQTVWIGDRGSDQAKGAGDGTLNLNPGGTLLTARGFSRNAGTASGSGKFNFNGGLLRITRATGNVTKDLIGPGITVTLEGAGARIDTNTHSTILARDLAGPGGLEKLGQGSLTLTGKNSFKGDTKVTTGVLALSGPALPANGTLHLNGGQAQLNGPITTAKLAFSGVPQTAGTWGATGSGATHIDDARFRGPGVLTVSVE
jgi:autotransporter-associated beta strand protein